MIGVENVNTLMSLACRQSFSCVFNTSVRVASHTLVFLFVDSVLVVQPLVRFVDNFDQSLVCSTFYLDQ